MKELKIACGLCDARELTEDTLKGIDSLEISTGFLLTSPESQKLLLNRSAKLAVGLTVSIPKDVELSMHNSSFTITAGMKPSKKTMLIVNGSLTVEPGTEDVLEAYTSIVANGSATFPSSLAGILAEKAQMNGSQNVYPDGCTPVKSPLMLDKLFAVRARGKAYYSRKLVAVDVGADIAALGASGARFACKTAIAAESLVEPLIPMLEDSTKLIAVPDGCLYLDDNAELNSALVRRAKGGLYIDGDLFIGRDEGELLGSLKYLKVAGTVTLPRECEDRFFEAGFECEETVSYRGTLIRNKREINIGAAQLAREGFITAMDCKTVVIENDVTPEMIAGGLAIKECGRVICAPEQVAELGMVSDSVKKIGPEEEPSEEPSEEPEENGDVTRISVGYYKF